MIYDIMSQYLNNRVFIATAVGPIKAIFPLKSI
jgi:hypothetical protein